jgi:pentatricopeptide repeat protein
MSGLPEAPQRMDAVWKQMREQRVPANIITYNILLRFWCKQGRLDRIENMISTIRDSRIPITMVTRNEAVQGYAKAGSVEQAEEWLQEMLRYRETLNDDALIGEALHQILLAYRKIVDSNAHASHKAWAVNQAKRLFEQIDKEGIINDDHLCKWICEGGNERNRKFF